MKRVANKIKRKLNRLSIEKRYQEMIEKAYNFRQTDAGLSDFFEFEANKLLSKIHHLETE